MWLLSVLWLHCIVNKVGYLSHCCSVSAEIGQCVLIILCDVVALSFLVLDVAWVVLWLLCSILAILLGVIISIISVQFANRVGYLSHCCSVLSKIWPVCPYNIM